jgi:preprotein translocase subunit Sec61beta
MRWQNSHASNVMVTPALVVVVILSIAVVVTLAELIAVLAVAASTGHAKAYTLQAKSSQEQFYPVDFKKHSGFFHTIINSGT